MRASHRSHLSQFLTELADGIHSCLASANILHKRATKGQGQGEWVKRGNEGSEKIKDVRPKVRYVLYGLDEPLRVVSRIPEWVATYKDIPGTNVTAILKRSSELASLIDDIIRKSYRRGRPPSVWQRWRLKRKSKIVRSLWEDRFSQNGQ